MLCCAASVAAQQVQVVDIDGIPIPYVCITNAKGALVGSTDNEVEMEIQELKRFEKTHNIPPLPDNLQAALDKLFAKELSK